VSEAAALEDLQRRLKARRTELAAQRTADAALTPIAVQVPAPAAEGGPVCPRCSQSAGALVQHPTEGEICRSCVQDLFRAEAPGTGRSQRGPDIRDRLASAGGNPWRFGTSSFDTFEPWEGRGVARAAAMAFADQVLGRPDRFEPVRGVLLWGETGLAKTELLHCVLRHLVEGGLEPRRSVLLVDWRALVHEVQGTYGRADSWAVINRCIRTDVLLLDDLFAGKIKPDVVDIAFTILNHREGRPTVITMNPDPDGIAEHLVAAAGPQVEFDAERIHSRLGAYRVVQVRGEQDGRLSRG